MNRLTLVILKSLPALLLFGMLNGCAFKQEIHFYKDLSGKVHYSLDMGSMGDIFNSDSLDMELDEASAEMTRAMEELNKQEGLSNAFYNFDSNSGLMTFGYDFADINSLNRSLGDVNPMSGEIEMENTQHFSAKGKKVIYSSNVTLPDTVSEDALSFYDIVEYEMVFSFEDELDKFKSSNGSFMLSPDKRSVNYKSTLGNLAGKTGEMEWSVKRITK